MTRRWTLRLAACLVTGAAVLTGCSEKQEAAQTLPSSSSAAPTEDALPPLGPADLPMPAEARTQDAAGAEAFVRYYIELINRTSTVMDAQPLRDLSDGCRDCDRIADNTDADADAGYHYEGGDLVIKAAGSVTVTGEEARIAFTVDQAPLMVVDAGGARNADLSSSALTDLTGGALTTWNSTRSTWLMTTLTLG
ncbi:hypothetical protein SAMN05660748_1704 [Blastococcus aggregatus]|uniref:Lipoprotein n=1 Tax=Blastococcus aggregatus TaxID=38502 RepID=A0A285V4J5_9ACTN|nr:DUF6318 family protein [Blastococcus aggregatus]SOC48990.1 hypothetical protein SAMN05660748_1704 [Blastococcus aggregatus]